MTPMEHVARELGLLIRSLKGLHSASAQEAGVRVELPALAVLTALDTSPAVRPSALAEALHVDLSSISRQVAGLEREGWVARSRDPADSRAALLELTAEGHDTLSRVRASRVAQLTGLLPDWTADELAAFAQQLHRFRTDLSAANGPDTPSDRTTDRTTTDRVPALAGQESS